MLDIIKGWLKRYLSDYEAVTLLFLLLLSFFTIIFFGNMLAPVFAALIIAFLLQGVITTLLKWGVPRLLAVNIVFFAFMTLLLVFLLVIVPLIWEQITHLLNEIPRMVTLGQNLLHKLSDIYPSFLSDQQMTKLAESFGTHLAGIGQWALSFSLAKLPGAVGILIYMILLPILVFFFLKDKILLINWCSNALPKRRRLIMKVSNEMHEQIANYIRGKAIEIALVSISSFIGFALLGLKYSTLLALLVGLSVVIPYIGATVVTIPVALIAFFQWGFSHDFVTLMIVYGVTQAIDGNILVPLLFSEAVNLHPIAIIIAVLLFGGLWGFWGIFFAIPLATLCKAVINAWPKTLDNNSIQDASQT